MIDDINLYEPEIYSHFPRVYEFRRLLSENKDGRFTEYFGDWLKKFRVDAIRATENEKDGVVRGGMVAEYMLKHVPVIIEPQDVFATFGLVPRTYEETNELDAILNELPSCIGNFIHFALDYKRLFKTGIEGLLQEIESNEKKLSPDASDDNKRNFYRSARLSLGAILMYADRYREEAERLLANETDPVRMLELERIRDALKNVPYKPAETLFEAMQSLQIFQFAMCTVENLGVSIGRVDFILHNYYENDLAAGRVTKAEAAEWIQLLMIRSVIICGHADSFILAGSSLDGKPFWNDITYFILDGVRALRLRSPQIWFRYANGLPRSLLRRAVMALREGTSHPGFFNDAVSVPAMTRAGITEEHAYDYVACQCTELSSAGRSAHFCGAMYYNLAKPIEILLNKGKALVDEKLNNPWSGYWPDLTFPDDIPIDHDNFDNLLNAYEFYLRSLLKSGIRANRNTINWKPAIVLTITSTLVDRCIESGKAILEGGALYNQTYINFTGLVTAADSLAAIRKCVFEDKKLTLDGLAEICRNNYESSENIRLYLLNKCPKFGNDDPKADSLAKFIYDIVADELFKHKNVYGDTFAPQYFGLTIPEYQAYTLAATPDGRLYGEAPSGTLGGDLGRDSNGMTALFNSVTSFDHTLSSGGLNVNLRINQTVLNTDEDMEKMIDLLISYFEKGGMEVQINCISKDILLDAQKHPEKHKDLCVRIAGQSTHFITLGPAQQLQVINRVEHNG